MSAKNYAGNSTLQNLNWFHNSNPDYSANPEQSSMNLSFKLETITGLRRVGTQCTAKFLCSLFFPKACFFLMGKDERNRVMVIRVHN